jgi:hypothetical protein
MFKLIYQQEKTSILQILIFFLLENKYRGRRIPGAGAMVWPNHIVAVQSAGGF